MVLMCRTLKSITMTKKNKNIFNIIATKLIATGIVSADECALIARSETRKEGYWKRHILDLCQYALNKMEREGIDNLQVRLICETGIRIALDETTTHTTGRESERD